MNENVQTEAQHAMPQSAYSDLTTTRSAVIEDAKDAGQLYLDGQPYELYSSENHEAWKTLRESLGQLWPKYACRDFVKGVEILRIDKERVPRLEDINALLTDASGFVTRPVSGYIPSYRFFSSLSRSEFPSTITIRGLDALSYLPEPDIFHDIHGHVPMFANPNFAKFLTRFGSVATAAAEYAADIDDVDLRISTLSSILKALARLFWFTIEFGLIREDGELRAYGGGLLSSSAELVRAIDCTQVQRYPFQIEWVVNQAFSYDRFQPVLFYIHSLSQLEQFVTELEVMIVAGRLSDVAPGDPEISEDDLTSFLRPVRLPF